MSSPTPPTENAQAADPAGLFAPRSVAIIGASSDQRRFGGRPVQYLIEAGFEGPIYPVNLTRSHIQGLPAFPAVAAIGKPIDCAILATSAEATNAALDECIAAGVKSAVLFGAGFSEAGPEGAARQQQLADAARRAGVRLLGPNCMGLLNTHARFYATFASALEEHIPPPGHIGVASQSGGFGGYLMKHLFLRGLGISQWVTTGNEADIEIGEAMHFMAGQEETRILLGYIEGLRSSDKLIAALALAQRNAKPVIMMKVGRTAEGSAAAASHTGSLTGEDRVYDAVFERYGVHRARTTDEMLDIAHALSLGRYPRGRSVGVISISGGVGVQIADYVSDAGLKMGRVPETTQAQLRELVPHCSPHNPIDMTGLVTTNHEIMEKTLDAIFASGAFDAILIFIGISGAAPSMARPLQDAVANAMSRSRDQLVFVSVTAEPSMLREYYDKGMIPVEDPSRAVAALAALVRLQEGFSRRPAPAAARLPAPQIAASAQMDEVSGKRLLAQIGIRAPKETVFQTAGEAAAAASQIGFPVALKIVSPDIPHKTEAGGVALNLASPNAVQAAAETMLTTVRERCPTARLEGFLVSEMVKGGVECILGVHRDPSFGPVLTFGLGGIAVELIRDTVCALAPVDLAQARGMIGAIRTAPLLTGYRGGPAYDVEALAEAVVALSYLAAENADTVSAIEINPLVAMQGNGGVVALDSVINIQPRESIA
jgi:acyl-CoA synthetase (NDP forming)